MDRIVLEVDDQIAKAWRNMSAKLRAQIGKNLERVLTDSVEKSKEANFELLLNEIRSEAVKNGLNEEVLSRLLH